jgi:hypothetical protein
MRKMHGQTTHSKFLSLKILLKLFVSRLENIEALGDVGIQACVSGCYIPITQHWNLLHILLRAKRSLFNGLIMQLYKYIFIQTFSTNQTRKCFSSGPDTSHVSMPVKASVLLDRRQTEFMCPKPAFDMDIYYVACSVCWLQEPCNRRILSHTRKDSISLIIIRVSLK